MMHFQFTTSQHESSWYCTLMNGCVIVLLQSMWTCTVFYLQKLNNLPKVDNAMYGYATKTANMVKNRDSHILPRKSP